METWQQSEIIYEGAVVRLRCGEVHLDDGTPAQREVVEHPGGVCVIPFDGEQVHFVRQFRIAVGEYVLEGPAGKLEPGETDPEARGRAELEEETGFRAGRVVYAGKHYASVGFCSEIIHIYLAFELTPVPRNLDPEERIDVVAMPIAEVRRKLAALEFHDGKTIIGLHALLSWLESATGEGI